MARKHQPGCPCCGGTCYELLPEDLPTVTPPAGWSIFQNWTGGPCCKCLVMIPDDPTETEACSAVFGTGEQEYNCEWDIIAWEKEQPAITDQLAVCPADGTPYCTTKNKFTAGTGVGYSYCKEEWKLLTAYQPTSISLCISKQNVDCGSGPQLKWVLSSEYRITVEAWYVRNQNSTHTRTITATNACFSETTTEAFSCDFSDSDSVEHPCTKAAAQQDVELENGDAFSAGFYQHSFCRIKLFDNPPDGTITFSNADILTGCTFEFECHNQECTPSTQFCVNVSSWPCRVRPCWCDATWDIVPVTTTVNYRQSCISIPDENGGCGVNGVGCDDPLKCVNFTYINPPECDVLSLFTCCLPVTDPGSFTVTDYRIENFDVPTGGVPGDCCNEGTGRGGSVEATCGGGVRFGQQANIAPICHVTSSLFFYPFCIEFTADCTPPGCNASCCWVNDCNLCTPKFELVARDETLFTVDMTCSFSPVSACFNAPSWTVTLS